MQKFKSLLKMAFAGALLFSFAGTMQAAYPALSTLNGRHNETCTRVLGPNYTSNTVLAGNLDPNSYFTVNSANSTINNDEWIGNMGNKPFTYDQVNGTINFKDNDFGYIQGLTLKMMNEDGTEPLTTWYVTEDGDICIPNFTIYSGANLVATFTDIVVDEYKPKPQDFERGEQGGGDDNPGTADNDVFNWTVQTITDLYGAQGDVATFKVKIEKSSDNGYSVTEVDGDTFFHGGTLKFTITGAGVQYGSTQVTIDGKSIDFMTFTMSGGVAMPNNSYLNGGNTFDPATGFLGFSSDSGFGFYDMSLMSFVSGFKLLSSTPATGGEDNTGDVAGSYEIYLQPVDLYGGTLDAVKVNVNIILQSEGGEDEESETVTNSVYVIEEVGTNYLLGQKIPFEWSDATGFATFNQQFYVGNFDDVLVWFTPFLFNGSTLEGQEQILYPFTPGVGFGVPQSQYGIGFFDSTSEKDLNPNGIYKAYYLVNGPEKGNGKFDDGQGGDTGSYPAIKELAGTHTLTADVTYEAGYNIPDITKYFPSTKVFSISENGAAIEDFVGSIVTIGISYDSETGVITPKTNNLGSVLNFDTYTNYNFGWANKEGDFTGLMVNGNMTWGTSANLVTIQVDKNGHIIIPDFTIVNYDYGKGGPIMVRYNNVIVDGFDPSIGNIPTSLTFEDVEMEVEKNSPDPVTATVDVKLQANPAFTYQGFQFDVEVPAEVEITGVTSTVIPGVQIRPVPNKANTYRVLGYLSSNAGTAALGTVASLKLSTTWSEDTSYPVNGKMTISNPVFSTVTGDDITNVEGYVGNLTIKLHDIPAEEIIIDKVTVMEPSSSLEEGNADDITVGESLNVELSFEPEDATTTPEDIEWEASVDGVTFEFDEEGNLIVNTNGVDVDEPTDVTITGKLGDVETEYTFTINPVILGDSNNNGEVTVADVVTTSNYMISDPVARFDFPNANVILTEVDSKQVINSADLEATIEIVFDTFNGQRNVKRQAAVMNNNDYLVADNFKAVQGKETVIGVSLDNSVAYRVLQATVVIPEGMTVVGLSKGERAAAHELAYNILPGEVKLVLYSLSNVAFSEGDGQLFNIHVVADENCGDLSFENVNAADSNSNAYYFGYVGGKNVTGTTGIDSIDADEDGYRYFDLNGIEIARPDKGVYIRVNAAGEAVKVVK